jgi:hypothetical protein
VHLQTEDGVQQAAGPRAARASLTDSTAPTAGAVVVSAVVHDEVAVRPRAGEADRLAGPGVRKLEGLQGAGLNRLPGRMSGACRRQSRSCTQPP